MKYILLSLIVFNSFFAKTDTVYDVVVYNATPAGITAAVAAAREGRSVIIIEPLPLVGGIMSGGLSFSDSNQTARETLGGLFEEFHLRVEKEYLAKNIRLPYSVKVKDQKPWTYEPHVAEKVFNDMLREAGVKIVLNETLKSVQKTGGTITSIKSYAGNKYAGKVFIDASYEGDLMAAAKVEYRLGRESSSAYNESWAGARYPKPVVKINVYDDRNKLLPLMTSDKRSVEGEGDNRIMAYSFRLCFSRDPENKVPFRKPANYDPKRYELIKRLYIDSPTYKIPFDRYVLPNNKWDGNNSIGGQLSLALVGKSDEYPEANPKKRAKIWQEHRDYTEGFFYFLLTDPSVPQHVKKEMNELGYAKDEFQAFGNFPPVLYVREGRRMVGEYFMTQNDILQNKMKDDVVAISSFPVDSHDCQRIAVEGGGFVNEGTIFPKRLKSRKIGHPYQFPYRAMIPKSEQCDNLLVPVGISASHVAFSSVRVEPTWMVLGQSAGIAAALAVEKKTSVQNVNIKELQSRLVARGQILTMPEINEAP